MNDPLRDRLRQGDPLLLGDDTDPVPAAPPPELLERIMSTPVVPDTVSSGSSGPSGAVSSTSRPARSRWKFALGGAAAAALIGIGGVALLADRNGGTDPIASPPLELELGPSDPLASCLPFDVQTLAGMSVAFEGTVTDVTDDTVALTVDRWFRGGEADTVVLASSADDVALVGGADFVVGSTYLVSAEGGAVSVCGYTGPATDDLRAAFEQAFAA